MVKADIRPKIMREDDVAFRPSMIKYRIADTDMAYGLNVVRVSAASRFGAD